MVDIATAWVPNVGPQSAFLASTAREVLYGGAVYGGKSEAIAILPLRFIEHPKHRAIILRRTRPQLQETIDRTLQLYPKIVPGAQWREAESRWRFPSGAIIQMGYAEHEKDIYHFQTFEYNLILFDELTSFTEPMYAFMMLRNRTKDSVNLPLWIRSGTNPGDIGHEWVYNRFIKDREPYKTYKEEVKYDGKIHELTRQFIPSSVYDNAAMSADVRDEYIAGIVSSMPAEDVAAYLGGDWNRLAGSMFKVPLFECSSPSILDNDYYMIRAIDYGWDDYTCVLWCSYYPKKHVLDIVSELYVRETTLDGIAEYIKARERDLKMRNVIYSVGSPEMGAIQATSGQSISSMLTAKGVHVERANTDRLAGWANVLNMTAKGAIRVWPGAAPNLLRTLPKLQRNSGPGKDPNDIRKYQEDHAADALRYAVMAVYETPASTQPAVKDPPDPSKQDVTFDKMITELQKNQRHSYFDGMGEW